MLLSTAYFPPLEWFALAARDMTLSPDRVLPSCVELEAFENYQKQSYRNRCYILAGDGVQMLQVPVVHGADMGIRSVLVDYSTPWVVRSERALSTAYETSAYFHYYKEELFRIMESGMPTLWELNLELIRWCLKETGIAASLSPTVSFRKEAEEDFRYVIHPKKSNDILEGLGLGKPYYQVFRDRMGSFTKGLSILDLLFNEGPDSILWLKKL